MLWTSDLASDTRFIAIRDNILYIANPKPAALDAMITEFKYHQTPPANAMSIPFNYIRSVHLYEGKNMIELHFSKDSTEEIILSDAAKKEALFTHLKNALPDLKYEVDPYSWLRAGKKPLIAIAVILFLFGWSYFVAYELQHGASLDGQGQRYNSIAGIILVLASLGTTKLILLFGALFIIASAAFYRKVKHPTVVRMLTK
jgi:hypothetical protein